MSHVDPSVLSVSLWEIKNITKNSAHSASLREIKNFKE